MVGPPVLLGLLAALIASQLQPRAWRGKAEIRIQTPDVAAAFLGTSSGATFFGDPRRYLETQAHLARSPALAARVVYAAGVPGVTAAQFLRHSSAKPVADASILTLSVSYRPRAAAVRLTNVYATQFLRFKNDLDTRSLREVLRRLQARIDVLRARGQAGSSAYQAMVQQRLELKTFGARLRGLIGVQLANGAASFRPHAFRNGLLGGTIGALLGVALVAGVAAGRRRAG
jgi:hypothetical protein